jgi:hypothetical protein
MKTLMVFFRVYCGDIYQTNFPLLNPSAYFRDQKRITVDITLTDGITDETRPSIYFRKLKINYRKYHC